MRKQIKDNMILETDFKTIKLSDGGEGNVCILTGILSTHFVFNDNSIKCINLKAETLLPPSPKLMIFTKTNGARDIKYYREYINALADILLRLITKIKVESKMYVGDKLVEENIKDIVILKI